jgi:hypothetical protein
MTSNIIGGGSLALPPFRLTMIGDLAGIAPLRQNVWAGVPARKS